MLSQGRVAIILNAGILYPEWETLSTFQLICLSPRHHFNVTIFNGTIFLLTTSEPHQTSSFFTNITVRLVSTTIDVLCSLKWTVILLWLLFYRTFSYAMYLNYTGGKKASGRVKLWLISIGNWLKYIKHDKFQHILFPKNKNKLATVMESAFWRYICAHLGIS